MATTSESGPYNNFQIEEATIEEIQLAFEKREMTSTELVKHYLRVIESHKDLCAVIEVNKEAIEEAENADNNRNLGVGSSRNQSKMLQGIPILLKDNIATDDDLGTTSGSLALVGSIVREDARVVQKLREAGAIILGKANLSEWSLSRSINCPDGWSARGGTVKNPYAPKESPAGSSCGSAVSVAANLVTVSLGTDTVGSITNPACLNCVVGIKPTVGLTSRSGVIPISLRQDSVGPIGRTVSDAVHVLDVIVGEDPRDEYTPRVSRFIPEDGYKQFLKGDGLAGKRIGNLWDYCRPYYYGSPIESLYLQSLIILSNNGASIIPIPLPIHIPEYKTFIKDMIYNEDEAMRYELKHYLNNYLCNLVYSKVRSLSEIIDFNKDNKDEKVKQYGQSTFLSAEHAQPLGREYFKAINKLRRVEQVFEKLMLEENLDAVVIPEFRLTDILGIGGYPRINVPAGFNGKIPFGISFSGLKGSEPKLIEIAYAFEQATKFRKPPEPLITKKKTPAEKLKDYMKRMKKFKEYVVKKVSKFLIWELFKL